MNRNFLIRLLFIGFLCGLINGLFGSGGGTILVPALYFLTTIGEHKSHATAISIILPLTILSTYIYFLNGDIIWSIGWKIIIGGIIGGYLGARFLNKISSSILRKIFGVFMIIAAIRMVF